MQQTQVHISEIKAGDTIFHNDQLCTVCRNNIKRGFMGITLFGDSYQLGTVPVIRVDIEWKRIPSWHSKNR